MALWRPVSGFKSLSPSSRHRCKNGHLISFRRFSILYESFKVISNDDFPFRLLNCFVQSVNGLNLLWIKYWFNQIFADLKLSNPLIVFKRPSKCELRLSIRLVVLGTLVSFV